MTVSYRVAYLRRALNQAECDLQQELAFCDALRSERMIELSRDHVGIIKEMLSVQIAKEAQP